MIDLIMEEIFEYDKNNNKPYDLFVGKKTFKKIYEEAHPEKLTTKTIKQIEDEGYLCTMVGIRVYEANFDYGYYLT